MPAENRRDPTRRASSPVLIRAFHTALEEAIVPVSSQRERQGQFGKRWALSYRRTLTPTQNALYVYIENINGRPLDFEGAQVYTNGETLIDLYDEPTLDETTFNTDEFRNVRSSVTKDPPWDAYSGTENNVTVSDEGREFLVELIQSGQQKTLGQGRDAPGYIIDPGSSGLIKITNNTNGDILISATMYFHEQAHGRDLTDLEGMN